MCRLFCLFPQLVCIRFCLFWGHATKQTIRSCRCSLRIKLFCCLILKNAQGFWHSVCFVPCFRMKRAFSLCGISTSSKSMGIIMHYVWKSAFTWSVVDSSFVVIQKWIQRHALQPLCTKEFEDQLQPFNLACPSSLTLLDGLIIKLVSRVSWSEYSLLCAHTLCGTISSIAKVDFTKQTRDKKESCENDSTCKDRVAKEINEGNFVERFVLLFHR